MVLLIYNLQVFSHYPNLRTLKSCEIFPCSALKLKMLNQRTNVRFLRIFNFALITTKFLGE